MIMGAWLTSKLTRKWNKNLKIMRSYSNWVFLKIFSKEDITQNSFYVETLYCPSIYDTIRYANKGHKKVLSPISIANLSRAPPAYYKRVTTTVPGVGPRMACTRYQCQVTHENSATHNKPNLYYLVKQWQLTQVPKHTLYISLYCAYQSHIT